MSHPRISIIGLGKLGASMAAAMASRGLNVIAVDVNRTAVNALNTGLPPVQETGLADLISAHRSRLHATMNFDEAVRESDISFVIVPTPSDERGAFSLQYAAHAFRELGRALRDKRGYHVIVLSSTVLPGSTRHGLLPLLEKESGKRCGVDFGLCYSPEFIALGSVIHDFLNPDFFLIGEFDRRSGDRLAQVNEIISINQAPSKRMSIENAELAKIAVNSFVTMKISFANMLAELCEQVPEADVDVVSDAIGMDKRIGRRYLTGGFGFGGPCFPRDNFALAFICRSLGTSSDLMEATDHYNRTLSPRLTRRLMDRLPPVGSTVAVLGLAYKPQSHVVDESPGIHLARSLSEAGYRVLGYDPLAALAASAALGPCAVIMPTLTDCIAEADAVLVTTTDPEFTGMTAKDFVGSRRGLTTVVDFWRCLDASFQEHPLIDYLPMGRCMDHDASETRLRALWTRPSQASHGKPTRRSTAFPAPFPHPEIISASA